MRLDLARLDTVQLVPLTPFSADGTTAVVANHGDGTVSVLDLATARVTKTFKAGTGIETLAYY